MNVWTENNKVFFGRKVQALQLSDDKWSYSYPNEDGNNSKIVFEVEKKNSLYNISVNVNNNGDSFCLGSVIKTVMGLDARSIYMNML